MHLIFFVAFLGLGFLIPDVVYGGTAATSDTHSLQQRIDSVTEIDSPSPYHITLVVRTGLDTGEVWIQRADGGNDRGILVSYGELQRVWQLSHMVGPGEVHSVIINANHTLTFDENLISRLFRIGYTESPDNVTNSSTPQRLQPETEPLDELPEIHNTITVLNRGYGEQLVTVESSSAWRGIDIIGDERFVQRTLRALEAVERGPAWAYDYVVTYLDYVKQHSNQTRLRTGGHVNVRTRTFYVYNITYTSHSMWYAGLLVHEAVHVRQFREYLESYGNRTPRRITFYSAFADQMRLEMEALDIQIRFLEEAGASRQLINTARSFIGTVWWR